MDTDSIEIRVSKLAHDAVAPLSNFVMPVINTRLVDREWLKSCTQDQLLKLIHKIIVDLEMHEIDEWFKLDGKCITEPHP